MPLVQVMRDPEVIGDAILLRIVNSLPGIVATALDIPSNPEGRLTSDDIEVLVRDKHRFDVSAYPFSIIIQANDFPERRKNQEERGRQIADRVKAIGYIPSTKRFVWLILSPAAFVEF